MSPVLMHLFGITLFMLSPLFVPVAVHAVAWVSERLSPPQQRRASAVDRLARAASSPVG